MGTWYLVPGPSFLGCLLVPHGPLGPLVSLTFLGLRRECPGGRVARHSKQYRTAQLNPMARRKLRFNWASCTHSGDPAGGSGCTFLSGDSSRGSDASRCPDPGPIVIGVCSGCVLNFCLQPRCELGTLCGQARGLSSDWEPPFLRSLLWEPFSGGLGC